MCHDLLYRVRALIRRRMLDSELQEELSFHLEHQAEKYERAGVPREDAYRRARIALGGVEQVREACSYARGTRLLEDFLQDCGYALRGIRRSRSFSAVILVVLALGIGINTAVFNLVDAEIIKPLPFREPSRLFTVWDRYLPQFTKVGISPAELLGWQSQKDIFQQTAWYRYVPLDGALFVPGSDPIAVRADFVAANLFPMLGVSPLAGRMFNADEDPSSVLISEHVWRQRFAASPEALGRTLHFNGQDWTVVGVIPDATQFPEWADVWLPKGPLLGDQLTNPVRHALGFLARLKAGVGQEQVSSRLPSLARALAREHPRTSTGWSFRFLSLHDDLTGDVRPTLVLLFCAASFLLMVVCTNVASLLLSRASARAKEMAVRIAVGAGAARIVRQLMTESLMLSLLGGSAGFVMAVAVLRIALPAHAHIERVVVLFLLLISFFAGMLFGLAPAVQLVRAQISSTMKAGTATSSGMTTRSILVISQIALTMMLVIGAGLLVKSFVRLTNTDLGFNPEGVLAIHILAPPSQQPELLFHRIQDKLLSMPGVREFAVTNALALLADRANTSRFNVPGSSLINADALPGAQIRTASPGYFKAMQIALKAGRTFTERDLDQPVVIINETMAKRFWPARSAVGQRFINGPWGPDPSWATIVGVVGDVKQFGLDSEPTFDEYYPSLQGQYLMIKGSIDPRALATPVQRAIHSLEPELAISDVQSMHEVAKASASKRRWTMGILVTFASLALLMALLGIYGTIAWSVAQRTREIGIRVALGADRAQVLRLFLRIGLKLTLAGLGCGTIAALVFRQVLVNFVFDVSTADPVIYGVIAAMMLAVALPACYVPARRATKVDPLISLRYD